MPFPFLWRHSPLEGNKAVRSFNSLQAVQGIAQHNQQQRGAGMGCKASQGGAVAGQQRGVLEWWLGGWLDDR